MNPVEIENDIRALEVMLHGGGPVRPVADFGRDEVGHFEDGKSRASDVRVAPGSRKGEPAVVVERRVRAEDGTMRIEGP